MKILISACLLGEPVRYDANSNDNKVAHTSQRLAEWKKQGIVIPVCPELLGGLSVPRPAAEIAGGDGLQVLNGQSRILANTGEDVTDAFVEGAHKALEVALRHQAVAALLAARSPSCGSDSTYDGTFTSTLTSHQGVTAALLSQHGIRCFTPERFNELEQWYSDQDKG